MYTGQSLSDTISAGVCASSRRFENRPVPAKKTVFLRKKDINSESLFFLSLTLNSRHYPADGRGKARIQTHFPKKRFLDGAQTIPYVFRRLIVNRFIVLIWTFFFIANRCCGTPIPERILTIDDPDQPGPKVIFKIEDSIGQKKPAAFQLYDGNRVSPGTPVFQSGDIKNPLRCFLELRNERRILQKSC